MRFEYLSDYGGARGFGDILPTDIQGGSGMAGTKAQESYGVREVRGADGTREAVELRDKREAGAAHEAAAPNEPGGAGQAIAGADSHEHAGRKAVAVDADIRERNLKRLRRIEGQVRGLQRMVEEDRYCADIMTQISSVHEALRSVGRELMRNHLKHCAASAVRSSEEEAEEMYDELVEMMYRYSR